MRTHLGTNRMRLAAVNQRWQPPHGSSGRELIKVGRDLSATSRQTQHRSHKNVGGKEGI